MDKDFESLVFKHPLYTENLNTGHMYTGQVKDWYSDGSGF